MPVISFKVSDVLRAKLLDKAWYSYQISAVNTAASKNRDSVNYTIIFTLVDHSTELDGKEVPVIFNTKAISRMIPLFAAVKGIKAADIKPEAFDLDTDQLIGAKVDGNTDIDTYEGNNRNVIEDFAPYKSIVGKPSAF